MERKSLSRVLNLLIENGKGDDTYYLFDSNDNLIVEKNIILYWEVFINDTKR